MNVVEKQMDRLECTSSVLFRENQDESETGLFFDIETARPLRRTGIMAK